MQAGDVVIFTGHEYRRAKLYNYAELFKDKKLIVTETRSDCCNEYLIFDGIMGLYNSKLFEKAK